MKPLFLSCFSVGSELHSRLSFGPRSRRDQAYCAVTLFGAGVLGVAAVLLPASSASAAATDPRTLAARCPAGQPGLQMRVSGFKGKAGVVKIRIYGGNPADWLEGGKRLRLITGPVPRNDVYSFCVPVPAPGKYGVAVHHDANGDDMKDFGDGAGFSRNPPLTLLRLKPEFADVAVPVGRGPATVNIVMNYRSGLSIGPVSGQ